MTAITNSPTPAAPSAQAASIRTVIVDDEPAARRRLKTQLADFGDIRIVAEFGTADEFARYLESDRPDLVFMDIRMPGRSGLEVVRQFPSGRQPVVVFVTAYEEHALEAFGVQAADYLLKPAAKDRLARCVDRVRLLCAAEANMAAAHDTSRSQEAEKPLPLNRLVVPAGERMIVISAQQIDWIESAGNYAIIHVGRDTHVLRETLTELDQRLAAARFMRISRSTIVNMDRIRELRNNGGGSHDMVLADGVKLAITRGIREVQGKLETG